MSTAAPAVAIPTRSEIEAWTTSHLADAASSWRAAAEASEDAFDQHRQSISSPGGTTWEGDAKDAALDRVTRDIAVVGTQNEALLAAAGTAENAVSDINSAQREVLAAQPTQCLTHRQFPMSIAMEGQLPRSASRTLPISWLRVRPTVGTSWSVT
ncbi:hypothetical protein C6A86_020620 [Mycobacterium sp. ITM-2016-00316]|uniref:hypothetical protein n=1 Tax=Mycobacterium sp. ITM-2016-00316 TaxID=2099695 RepID=UPI000CF9D274|nr:hypothetical protein [Mycobacterium sp. ITM-2016-00316]WNG80600.1 hypothetical protein C6A86_020620 [Mycobacterium sp. ITM-2016-00316]